MTKEHQKNIPEFLKNSSKEQKTLEWRIDYAQYIEVSNRLVNENGSALDQWKTF
jgi:post-segregation antitoxin (ccd killing protein)